MSPLPRELLERVASAAVAEGLVDALYTTVQTRIGPLLVVTGETGLLKVSFPEYPVDDALAEVAERIGPRVVASARELAEVSERISAYLDGDLEKIEMPFDLRLAGTGFRREALEALARTTHAGEVVTYSELAARAGRPRAVRAAGTACATNPIPLVVPCHRVVPTGGGIGNYGGGVERKATLLALEGALLG
jgi:methylated-DNA-[protein]-cysteine S-methyltransferase